MGISYYTNVCYGFIIYKEDGYIDPIFKNEEKELWEIAEEDLYDTDSGVEIVYFGWEPQIIALAVSETVESHEYEPFVLECKEPNNQEYIKKLKDYCKKHKLMYKDPAWIAGIQIS